MGKITARDIAKAANVSLSTVDRVLNNRGGVTDAKERRVIEWARKLKIDRALNQRAARTLRIAVLLQRPENPFHASVQANFEAAARDFPQFNLQFKIHHIDPVKPRATAGLIGSLIKTCDGMVIVSAADPDIAAALREFGTSGKPVITLVTDIAGSERFAYVGPDNVKTGRIAGDLMGRLLGRDGGDVIVISGMLSMMGHKEREVGFRTVLNERYSGCRVTDVVESLERAELAGDLVYSALKRNSEIRGIYNASAGASSVVVAVEALGRADKIVFITHELTEDRRQLLRDGLIDVIIDQGPAFEVHTAIEALAAFFGRREEPPASFITPVHIHTIENC
ncbi:LacI family transcriptional regulator (plasmid) [Agrobacterium fabrum]|uniref:LacI family DNA-binding transcriptional regulator n=1 Tax=Agrobacterium fabrum TaxID=1176649 RepID=UPI0021CEA2EE|nr:LacI family DNA-binding transcriptional regulator [Agrobacterium fabrum]UXT61202.1 LacI family transcriptional regulator [Agrobacterium fabrum]